MPDAAGLVEIAEITKRGNKYRARKVCSRNQENALPTPQLLFHTCRQEGSLCLANVDIAACKRDPGAWPVQTFVLPRAAVRKTHKCFPDTRKLPRSSD